MIEPHIATLNPAQLRKPIALKEMIRWVATQQYPDPPHPAVLLSARHEGPCCRPAEPRDESPPSHSITSSARASSVGGTVRPSASAVLRLIMNSNLIGCITGRSAGLIPESILPV